MQLKERFQGCVFGAVIGELMATKPGDPTPKIGPQAQLSICGADALIRCNGGAETFKDSLTAGLVSLRQNSDNPLDCLSRIAIDMFELTPKLETFSEVNSCSLLVGAYWHDIFTKAIQYGIISSETMSDSTQAKCGSVAAAVGTLLAFKDVPLGCLASEIGGITSGIDNYFGKRLKAASRMVAEGISPEVALGTSGLSGSGAADSMACSVYCSMKSPEFEESIRLASLCPNESSVVGCVVGAWQGARIGIGGLPPAWIDQLEAKRDLETLATDLEAAFMERKKKKNDIALMADYA